MSAPNISLDHYEATVKANPKRHDESSLAYIERIAVIAGGIQPGEGFLAKDHQWFDTEPQPEQPEQSAQWLPYRDP